MGSRSCAIIELIIQHGGDVDAIRSDGTTAIEMRWKSERQWWDGVCSRRRRRWFFAIDQIKKAGFEFEFVHDFVPTTEAFTSPLLTEGILTEANKRRNTNQLQKRNHVAEEIVSEKR